MENRRWIHDVTLASVPHARILAARPPPRRPRVGGQAHLHRRRRRHPGAGDRRGQRRARVVNATMVRPLPFPHSDRLVQLFLMPPGPPAWTNRNPLSPARSSGSASACSKSRRWKGCGRANARSAATCEPETVSTGAVSPGLFALLGGVPALGRTFTEDEDRDNAQGRRARPRAVAAALRRRRRHPRPNRADRPRAARGDRRDAGQRSSRCSSPTELWTPLNAASATLSMNSTFVQTFARLRPGVAARSSKPELGRRCRR